MQRGSGYSGTPLPKKLGIADGATVALLGAPPGIAETLAVPPDVTLRYDARGNWDLLLFFVTSRVDLARRLPRIVDRIGQRSFWIAWPKRASGVQTDITEDVLRELALPLGVVDYKVCAIDETWSGLKFAMRRRR